ncbi:FAD-binding oxidoreductase [Xanthomonadaceae bacterium JHOS43]|nr:FAD-binding oxidoreductase [Xanthomonadaceae bacterium JHOS43]
MLSQHARYRLHTVTTSGSAVHLQLVPEGRRIPFHPGQFAFLSFQQEGLREPHPFTIASAEQPDGGIAFMVRALGDYTARLVKEAKPGMVAEIYAPYGRFNHKTGARREIWIAGGVGVTPFISWLKDTAASGLERVTFLHFFTPGRETPESVELPKMAQEQGIELIEIATGPGAPAFRQHFAQRVQEAGASQVRISFCGPAGLLDEVRRLMRENGVAESQLRHEIFEFR